ncbi:MAG TPA: polysaccharide deacetylase family protein [Thermoanaerobaculia bacterium]|nr:polysaccharide deacetylase family protein [Thermoanaerobaculia bacterium]
MHALTILPLLGLSALAAAVDPPVATILGYHEVDPSGAHQHTTIPRRSASAGTRDEQLRYTVFRENFVQQLDYLEANGYTVIPLSLLVGHLRGTVAALPPRAVVLTVDDGWSCTYSEVLPELRRRGMPFTVFVYPKFVGRGSHAMTWQQIEELACEGVEVESHSYTHPLLTRRHHPETAAYDEFLRHELLGSRAAIERATARPVRYFCYPFGDHDEEVAEAAAKYGYEAAVTTERGAITRSTPLMRLNRYLIHNDTTLDEFRRFLLQN